MQADVELIGTIYEAAANPDLWPGLLADLGQLCDAEGGVLFAVGGGSSRWVASESMRQHMIDFVEQGWVLRNCRAEAGLRVRAGGFVTDQDVLTPVEIETHPMFTEFFRPRGLGWSIGSLIMPLTGDMLVISFDRLLSKGPVPNDAKLLLDPLRPHIARAAALSARLGLEHARGMTAALAMIGIPAAVVRANGRVIAANRSFEAASQLVAIRAHDRLRLKDAKGDALLTEVLNSIRRMRLGAQPYSVALRDGDGAALAIAHLVPLVRSSRDFLTPGDLVVLLAEPKTGIGPPASILEALFDLTPAEAKVAGGIGRGMSVDEVAASLSLSPATVRTQLKAVFAKTGVDRQARLVTLVTSFSTFSTSGGEQIVL